MGTITLLVVVGAYPQQIAKEVNFLVVDCSSSYKKRKVVTEPTEVLEDILLDKNKPERFTRIGASMEKKMKQDLVQFLKKSIDVFMWNHEDMPGIDPSVITHRLNMYPSFKPVRQKKRVFTPERDNAIKE